MSDGVSWREQLQFRTCWASSETQPALRCLVLIGAMTGLSPPTPLPPSPPLSSLGLGMFSQASDCFFLSLNGITLRCGGRGGGADSRLITSETALWGFYTNSAPSAALGLWSALIRASGVTGRQEGEQARGGGGGDGREREINSVAVHSPRLWCFYQHLLDPTPLLLLRFCSRH